MMARALNAPKANFKIDISFLLVEEAGRPDRRATEKVTGAVGNANSSALRRRDGAIT
jgi:hypothetical protein